MTPIYFYIDKNNIHKPIHKAGTIYHWYENVDFDTVTIKWKFYNYDTQKSKAAVFLSLSIYNLFCFGTIKMPYTFLKLKSKQINIVLTLSWCCIKKKCEKKYIKNKHSGCEYLF